MISNSASMIGGCPSRAGSIAREESTSPRVADTTVSHDRPVVRSSRTARKRRSTESPSQWVSTASLGGSSGAKNANRTCSVSRPASARTSRTRSTSAVVVMLRGGRRRGPPVGLRRWSCVLLVGASACRERSARAHVPRNPVSPHPRNPVWPFSCREKRVIGFLVRPRDLAVVAGRGSTLPPCTTALWPVSGCVPPSTGSSDATLGQSTCWPSRCPAPRRPRRWPPCRRSSPPPRGGPRCGRSWSRPRWCC
jgi:hypothetical protein